MLHRLRRRRRSFARALLALLALAWGGAALAPCAAAGPAYGPGPVAAATGPAAVLAARCRERCPMPRCAGGHDSRHCASGCAVTVCAAGQGTTTALAAPVPAHPAHALPAPQPVTAGYAYDLPTRRIPHPAAADMPPPRPAPYRSFSILLL